MGHIIGSARTTPPLSSSPSSAGSQRYKSTPPPPPPPGAGRYANSNPLRRERGLRILTWNLPDALRRVLVAGLRCPPRQPESLLPIWPAASLRHKHEVELAHSHPILLGAFTLREVEVTRAILEVPASRLTPETREALLVAQGTELRRLYLALVAQLGEAGALAVFQQVLAEVS